MSKVSSSFSRTEKIVMAFVQKISLSFYYHMDFVGVVLKKLSFWFLPILITFSL